MTLFSRIAVMCVLLVFLISAVVNAQEEDAAEEISETYNIDEDTEEADSKKVSDYAQLNVALASYLSGSGAYYFDQSEFYSGFDSWLKLEFDGNFGRTTSYFFHVGIGFFHAPRELLASNELMMEQGESERSPYYGIYTEPHYQGSMKRNPIYRDIYSTPLAYFPYSYRSAWDGFIFPLNDLNASGQEAWPDTVSLGFTWKFGISGTALNDHFEWRIARIEREASAPVEGYSLALNKYAQPFIGYDLTLHFSKYVSLYHVTGALEYYDEMGIATSSMIFQNGFSLSMLTFSLKNYVILDIGSSVVWPKRFEIGYLVPSFHLMTQNSTGDFDNLAIFGTLKVQDKLNGAIWLSLFLDEVSSFTDIFGRQRQMFALQAGLQYKIPFISTPWIATFSYTKIEPFCYTHQMVETPWYAHFTEQAFLNHGYGLGYYLPPNSDEFKLVVDTKLKTETDLKFQFQMIRHGAEYGEYKVWGSSYTSELRPWERDELKKDFLNDGAYQWFFILKGGLSHDIGNLPFLKNAGLLKRIRMDFNMNVGAVMSYWKYNGSRLENDSYASRTGIILDMGTRIAF